MLEAICTETLLGELLPSILTTVWFQDEQTFAFIPRRVVRRITYRSKSNKWILELTSRVVREWRDVLCSNEGSESTNWVGEFDRLVLAPPLTLRLMIAQGRERGPKSETKAAVDSSSTPSTPYSPRRVFHIVLHLNSHSLLRQEQAAATARTSSILLAVFIVYPPLLSFQSLHPTNSSTIRAGFGRVNALRHYYL